MHNPPQEAEGLQLLRRLIAATSACDDSLLRPPHQPQSDEPPPLQQERRQAVPVLQADQLPYHLFVERFMSANKPVLIRGACTGWRAASDWVTPDGRLDIAALTRLAGHCCVSVTDTARHHAGAGPCCSMTLAAYFDWWKRHKQQQQQPQPDQLREQPPPQQHQQQQQQRQPLFYLKDFHFFGEFPDYEAYRLPVFFSDDWLNEFYDTRQQQQQSAQPAAAEISAPEAAPGPGTTSSSSSSRGSSVVATSDYRFVYVGPAGSWTPVHSDVLRSFSWSANVVGRKRWWLLPPCHTHLLLDRHGQLPSDFFAAGPAGKARELLLELVQEAGDALFVPSGWHHMVVNEDDTLSINHNWLNGHNIHWSWALLQAEHKQATALLEDCRVTAEAGEFEELVQRMLAANSGLNFEGFAAFLSTIMARRLEMAARLRQQLLGTTAMAPAQCGGVAAPVVGGGLQEAAAAGSAPQEPGHEQGQGERQEVDLQLQLKLQCAFDLKRASDALQCVQQAAVDAAGRNAALCNRQSIGSRPELRSMLQKPAAARAGDGDGQQRPTSSVELPGWVAEAQLLLRRARVVVEELLACDT